MPSVFDETSIRTSRPGYNINDDHSDSSPYKGTGKRQASGSRSLERPLGRHGHQRLTCAWTGRRAISDPTE